MPRGPKPLNKSSLRFIEKTQAEFSAETIELGNKLINGFSRADITAALGNDRKVTARIGVVAMRSGWIKNLVELPNVKPDMASILEALKWIRLMRSINSHR